MITKMKSKNFKDITLCFSGGAFKGLTYIGVLRALESNILTKREFVVSVTGVSIGAFFGLLYVIGLSSNEIFDWIVLHDIYKKPFEFRPTKLLTNFSVFEITSLMEKTGNLLRAHKLPTDLTFRQLFEHYPISLNVMATRLNGDSFEESVFNHVLSPNVNVLEAIRGSMALPCILPSCKINDDWYIDGVFSSNTPFYFNEQSYPNADHYIFKFQNASRIDDIDSNISLKDSFFKYLSMIVKGLLNQCHLFSILKHGDYDEKLNFIDIPVPNDINSYFTKEMDLDTLICIVDNSYYSTLKQISINENDNFIEDNE